MTVLIFHELNSLFMSAAFAEAPAVQTLQRSIRLLLFIIYGISQITNS